jgi:hypothetical protein
MRQTDRIRWSREPLALIATGLIVSGADAALQIPDWLTSFPGASNSSQTASAAQADSSYVATAPPAVVLSYYTEQLSKAGIEFKTSFDGIGNTIAAAASEMSCVVRLREADRSTRVQLSCANLSAKSLAWPTVVPSVEPVSPPMQTTPVPTAPVPAEPELGVYAVEYSIDGSARTVGITGKNASGGTEQHEIALPYNKVLYVRGGAFVYLSAQNKGATGTVHVAIRVNGRTLQQATSSSPYGIATASGRLPR